MTGLFLALHRHDERMLHYLVQRRLRHLDALMRAITHLADPMPAILTVLAMASSPAYGHAGRVGVFTLTLSHLVVQLLKRTCCRPRPSLPVGIASLIRSPDRFSFPSGHSAAGMSIALALVLAFGMPYGPPILALAVLVGISRSYLGVHYPGDVLVGWMLALLTFLIGGVLIA